MNVSILDILQYELAVGRVVKVSGGVQEKSTGASRGPEYSSACPLCGGKDRFRVWPQMEGKGDVAREKNIRGQWFCRVCGKGGDVFHLLQHARGWDFPQICHELKIGLTGAPRKARPLRVPQGEAKWEAQSWPVPSEKWRLHATRLAAKAHEYILGQGAVLKYLAGRGLPLPAVKEYGLGYLEAEDKTGTCLYRPRSAFDLPEEEKKRALWIPRGISIPLWARRADGEREAHRVRIRRRGEDIKNGAAKYLLLKGSGQAPMILPPLGRPADRAPWVIVEAELDAMTVHHACGGLVGVIAVLTNLGKPDKEAHRYLAACPTILVALDFDQADEKGRRPGRDASLWWKKNYRNSRRWPVPEGKDPGEAVARGVDLLQWVNDALPRPMITPAPAPQAEPQGRLGNFQSGPSPGETEETVAAATTEAVPERVCRHDLGVFEYLWADEAGDERCHIVCEHTVSALVQCLECPARPEGLDRLIRNIRKNRGSKN